MKAAEMQSLYPWLQSTWQRWTQLSGRLGHAYLFSGPGGIGMEKLVESAAQSIFCEKNNGCGQCSGCHLFATAQHPDFFHLRVLEEKKEITVDQARELLYGLNETAHQGGYKIAWIEQPERLNPSAFNALLKTLEEPAPQTLFLLTTHQLGRLPATIVSRCQQLSLTPPPIQEALAWLQQQNPQADPALIKRALRLNWGAPLDAQTWLDEGRFEQDAEWKAALKQMQSGQKTVSQSVEQWLKWPQPEAVFDYFYLWAVSMVRQAVYQPNSEKAGISATRLQNWLKFQQACLQAHNSWQRNANKNLVLEALCLEWLQLQSESTAEQPYHTVFQGNAIKGVLA